MLRRVPILTQAAVAAIALLIFFNPLEQLNAAEVGP
jgi:hypothetical protein